MDGPGFLDGLVGTITGILSGGYARMSEDLKRLLSLIVGLDLMLAALAWAAAYMSIFSTVIVHTLKMFAFVMLFVGFPVLTQAFIEFCIWGGLTAGGISSGGGQLTVAEFQKPSTVMMKGFEATTPINTFIQNHTGWATLFNFFNLGAMSMGALAIWLAFIVMSLYLVFTQILMYAVTAYIVIFIVFAALTHTSFLATQAIGLFFASAARLGVSALLTGLMFPFIESFFLPATGDPDMYASAWLAVGAWLILGLVWFASSIAHGAFAGGPALSIGNFIPGVSMARMAMAQGRSWGSSGSGGGQVAAAPAPVLIGPMASMPPQGGNYL